MAQEALLGGEEGEETPFTFTGYRSGKMISKRCSNGPTRLITLWIGLLLMAGAILYSTAKSAIRPVFGQVSAPGAAGSTALLEQQASAFAPFLDVVPSQDGTALFVKAGGVGRLDGAVFLNVGIGPGHDKDSYTMVYSDTDHVYATTALGFTPGTGASGPLSITTTTGLDTGTVDFYRAYVPASSLQTIRSVDGNLQLTLVGTDTLPADTYVVIVPGFAPPGPLPPGHRLVGSPYSVRAAGALLVTNRPMDLRFYYDEATLAGADPHTLAVFAWDAFHQRWERLGGRLFHAQRYLTVVTSRFTTYALMSTPVWRDDFDDFSGLDLAGSVNVTLGGSPDEQGVVLVNTPGEGTLLSQPITPSIAIAAWESLTFTAVVSPPTTTLAVDLLDLNGTVLLTHVVSRTRLDHLDPRRYPALRLRATLSSTVAGVTPRLDLWALSWQVATHQVYLPVVLR